MLPGNQFTGVNTEVSPAGKTARADGLEPGEFVFNASTVAIWRSPIRSWEDRSTLRVVLHQRCNAAGLRDTARLFRRSLRVSGSREESSRTIDRRKPARPPC